MRRLLILGLLSSLAITGCGKKTATTPPSTNAAAASGNPLTAPVDYLGAINQAQKVAVKQVDLASVKQAIQLFNAQEDRNPKDLTEIVTKHYLPRLPQLPPGMKYHYDATSGAVSVVKQQ